MKKILCLLSVVLLCSEDVYYHLLAFLFFQKINCQPNVNVTSVSSQVLVDDKFLLICNYIYVFDDVQILGPECGWRPVSLTDMITSESVKRAYKKANLYVHPDKVQQKGADVREQYIAEKVFDLLKVLFLCH